MNITINNISFVLYNSLKALKNQFNIIADRDKFDAYLDDIGFDLTEVDKIKISEKVDEYIKKEKEESALDSLSFDFKTKSGEKFEIEI
ncbi:hypothetical protein [uncultured Winogradskyella sp.]|uniref:hypothetical protein n=1 Tax=uncultured Winogradskyella sp. TaxID=395353 RepID=UPI0030EDB97F|tara:strand:- start:3200 stop:3463 length:264 start_codon:yes stop_codon:yes gene_type:complete